MPLPYFACPFWYVIADFLKGIHPNERLADFLMFVF